MLLLAVALLVITQVVGQVADLVGSVGAFLSGLVVAAVYVYCGRKARAGLHYQFWILAPTITFVVIPAAIKAWRFISAEEQPWWRILLEEAPFLFGFIIPLLLILWVYVALRRAAGDQLPKPDYEQRQIAGG
jgi:hypothetical protein